MVRDWRKSRIMLAIAMLIAGTAEAPAQLPSPEDSLIELRIDCDVTAMLDRNGRSEPYGGGEYIFLLSSAYGAAKGKYIRYISTLYDGRTFLRSATVERLDRSVDRPFGLTLGTTNSGIIHIDAAKPDSIADLRLRGSYTPPDGGGTVEQRGVCRGRVGPPPISLPPR